MLRQVTADAEMVERLLPSGGTGGVRLAAAGESSVEEKHRGYASGESEKAKKKVSGDGRLLRLFGLEKARTSGRGCGRRAAEASR